MSLVVLDKLLYYSRNLFFWKIRKLRTDRQDLLIKSPLQRQKIPLISKCSFLLTKPPLNMNTYIDRSHSSLLEKWIKNIYIESSNISFVQFDKLINFSRNLSFCKLQNRWLTHGQDLPIKTSRQRLKIQILQNWNFPPSWIWPALDQT